MGCLVIGQQLEPACFEVLGNTVSKGLQKGGAYRGMRQIAPLQVNMHFSWLNSSFCSPSRCGATPGSSSLCSRRRCSCLLISAT